MQTLKAVAVLGAIFAAGYALMVGFVTLNMSAASQIMGGFANV